MNFEGDLKRVQRILLKEALTKGIQRNEEQCKVWSEYKKGHEKVAEALQTFQKEVHVNCMVPIGKRALMKGKLIHTNEILASLGDGYFAKYSAAGATALCQRRIQNAEEMLKNLNKERDLFETRIVASENNLFEESTGGEIVEHWNEDQIAEWKEKHKEKKKEYHQKLAKVRQEEQKKIETEEDLFNRLDQLELEEELADEIDRLEDEKYKILQEELGEESYSESESASDSESQEDEFNDETEENFKVKTVEDSKKENFIVKAEEDFKEEDFKEENFKVTDFKVKTIEDSKEENFKVKTVEDSKEENFRVKTVEDSKEENIRINTQADFKERNGVSSTDKIDPEESPKTRKLKKSVSFIDTDTPKETKETSPELENESSNEDDVLRIEFTHSENASSKISEGDLIKTPADIYRIFSKPKSILKRSPNDLTPVQAAPPEYSTDEEEDDDETVRPSAYENVVKEIKEKDTTVMANVIAEKKEETKDTRPVSKFKRDRLLKK